MRTLLIAGCYFCHLSGALADCDSDAKAAFARINTSGPYHFDKQRWDNGKPYRVIGKIIPGYRTHYRFDGEERELFFERERPGTDSAILFEKDAFGWKGRFSSYWSNDDEDPDRFFETLEYRCPGSTSGSEKPLLIFERTSRNNKDLETESLLVDPDSGFPVRRERKADQSYRNVVATYRFDPAITIERPKINLKARWDASIKAFKQSVQAAEPSCRQEVIEILDRGSSSLPFEYRVTGAMPWVGLTSVSGFFIPPNSTYQKWEGIPFHGGGSEFISIAGEFWTKSHYSGAGWKRTQISASTMFVQVSGDAPISVHRHDYRRKLPRKFLHHVGHARCLSAVTRENRRSLVYEYDVFRDGSRERKLLARRTMFVDPETRLPLEFEDPWPKLGLATHEKRRYDASLKVEAPKLGE
jgi:hypothetical protein